MAPMAVCQRLSPLALGCERVEAAGLHLCQRAHPLSRSLPCMRLTRGPPLVQRTCMQATANDGGPPVPLLLRGPPVAVVLRPAGGVSGAGR
eukprot:6846084-Lingulodinium_polyedra.AAC.1